MADPARWNVDDIRPPEPDLSNVVTEDDEPVDNLFSEKQQRLLTESLYASWDPPGGFVAMANVGLFFAADEEPLVPDAMVGVDVRLPEDVWQKKNRSWFSFQYGKVPDVAIEVVSNRKGGEDGVKMGRYAKAAVPCYVVFDPGGFLGTRVLRAWELHARSYVELMDPTQPLPVLDLCLTLWEGDFEGMTATWLRWRTPDGRLLLTGQERAREAEARAGEAEARAERLTARLRELGLEE